MSYNETINNYLYDEENEYTQANDLWEDFFMEKQDEIDERQWIQADDYLLHFACWLCSSSTSFTFMPPPTSYSRLASLEPALLFTEGRGEEEDCCGFCSAFG
jgi:hypothetical protein